jgi:Tol biopolymer transport system component/DNA-binding winged helix-turn-helix (wHTH) protein
MLMPRTLDIVRFGEFELDVRAYALTRHGRPVRLERRPMDLLILLVERRGELVSRTDIVDQLWGKDVFIEVEPAVNTAIKKIRRALNDSSEAPTFVETVPGKGYRFIAPVTTVVEERSRPSPEVSRLKTLGPVAAGVALFAVALTGWQWWSGSQASATPTQLVALTTLAGMERGPSFSPDARQVAFTWSGEAEDNWDIYVKLVGSTDVRRLTSHPNRDIAPKWSSDGRSIAYIRQESSGDIEYLRVMSALGGSDRQISDFSILPAPAWSPDDRSIAAGLTAEQTRLPAGIYLFPATGGSPRRLTVAPVGGSDWMPAFSPDGRHLAFASCAAVMTDCHVQVATLDASLQLVGSTRRLTREPVLSIRGVTWGRDGASVIYGAMHDSEEDMWQVDADGHAPPQRIEMASTHALFPATVGAADRLAFSRGLVDEDVYALEIGQPPRPVARSSVFDGNAAFAQDGKRVAFCSSRGDATEVWIANVDGSRAEQLTRGPGRSQCSPAWSPDDRSVVFESATANGESQIVSMDVDVRQPRQLTSGPGDRRIPTWSRTGEWVYFAWDPGSGRNIWRVSRNGGSAQRMTTGGSGMAAQESADGLTVFYLGRRAPRLHEPTDAPLLAQVLSGGPPREVVRCVRGTAFSVAAREIYYLPCRATPRDLEDPWVWSVDLATGRQRQLGKLEGYENRLPSGFAASPDGRTFLYNRVVRRGEDLMLIENFR